MSLWNWRTFATKVKQLTAETWFSWNAQEIVTLVLCNWDLHTILVSMLPYLAFPIFIKSGNMVHLTHCVWDKMAAIFNCIFE